MQVVVRNLTKRFAGVSAVADVSFEVDEGALLTLLGPSGSGKTTTLMMIAGFVEPDAGHIEIAGREVSGLLPNRRGLGVVFQSYALFPHKSVYGNVAFPLEIRKRPRAEIRERVQRMLELVRLAELGERATSELSGGQRQRVALARALVFEPPVLLMDEPLGALDKKLREDMQEEIKNLQRSLGVTAIHVTHDQEEALAISDYIGVMNDGRLIQIGSPAALYDEPATRFVAEFLGGVNLLAVAETPASTDGSAAVLTGGLRVPCHPSRGLAGPGAWLGVRPERVRLAPPPGGLFDARIVKRTYLGASIHYELEGPEAMRLQARVPSDDDRPLWEPGARVGVSWSARSAWLFD